VAKYVTTFWHEAPTDCCHEELFAHVEGIEEAQRSVHEANLYHACLYSNRDELGINWSTTSRSFDGVSASGVVTNNVIKQAIDTASSIIAKNKPRPRVLTSGAEWKERTQAKQLEKFLWGEFRHREVYRLGPRIFRDACVFGTGAVKVFAEDGHLCIERVLSDELIVDERTCIANMKPQEMFQRKLVDRGQLEALFPDFADEIAESGKTRSDWAAYRDIPHNQVLVVEAWRQEPCSRHVIAIENATLQDSEWDEDSFPFVMFRWSEPLSGFYGQGIAEELVGVQVRLNQLNRFIQVCQDLVAVPRVFMDVASKTLKAQITDEIGAIIPYRGKPPTFYTPTALTAEVYNERERLVRGAFERIGLSQMSAQSLKPAGLESAVALREFNEIEGQRFSIAAQQYETFFLDLAYKMVDVASDSFRRGKAPKTKYASKNLVEQIDWSDIDLDDESYLMEIQAASILSMSPAARMQVVTELAQVGQLDKSEIRYLLNNPDLERSDSMAYADFEDIERVMEQLLKGKYEAPEPFQNLELGMRRMQLAYLKAKTDGAPEKILENLRTWIGQAKDEMTMAQEQGVAPGAPVGMAEASQGPMGALPAAGATGYANVTGLPMPITPR